MYYSALVFAPHQSLVRKQFENEMPLWIEKFPEVQNEWSSLLQTLEGHTGPVNAVAMSTNSKTVASASDDGTVRLWDAATGASLQVLEGHNDWVNAVAFSADGKTVASASYDGTVRLWDAAAGAALQTFKDCMIHKLVFSREGPYLETNQGLLRIQSGSTSRFAPKLRSLCKIYVKGNWITQGEENLLWLPPDYRLACSAFQGNLLVIGHPFGKATFIQFSC